jgi:hypothetical protein
MGEVLALERTAHEAVLARHDQHLALVRRFLGDAGIRPLVEAEAWVSSEEYSHSMHLLGEVGRLAVMGALDTPEGRISGASLRENFDSSVIEMLHTDRQFREKLEINRERKHIVHQGKVLAHDGKTGMHGLCKNGAESAALEAIADERMLPVAARCAADERNVVRVEALPVGGFLVGVSMDPKEAMARHGSQFYEDLGFREGLAFLQWYYRVDEHTLIAASYSVDASDLQIMREVWAEFGGQIPAGEATDTWLDHRIEGEGKLEYVRELVVRIRDRFYEKRGITTKRYSVDEFMAMNQASGDAIFELYLKLAAAHHTGVKGKAIHALVEGLLDNPQNMRAEIHQQLSRIRRSRLLEKQDAALIEQLLRYAAAEHLRDGLRLLGTSELPVVGLNYMPADLNQQMAFAREMATKIQAGVAAGRTYGGCTRALNLSENRNTDEPDTDLRPQDAFGGKDDPGEEDRKLDNNGLIRCIKCRQNVPKRQVVKKTCWECPKCRHKVDICSGKVLREGDA